MSPVPHHDLEQELERLEMSLGLGDAVAPRVESVPAQQDPVRPRELLGCVRKDAGKCFHVLRVVHHGHEF